LSALAAIALAYLLGSLPIAWAVGRYGYGVDLRRVGDGNVGTGNVMNTCNFWAGIGVLFAEIGKGAAAGFLALEITSDHWAWVAGFAAMAGHIWPPWLGFQGGRGAAVALGVCVAMTPVLMACFLAAGLMLLIVLRKTTLPIAIVMAAYPFTALALGHSIELVLYTIALFVAAGLKDAWDRKHPRLREAQSAEAPEMQKA
jgi:glycerol-3-phosphate acyltransferase PlsY